MLILLDSVCILIFMSLTTLPSMPQISLCMDYGQVQMKTGQAGSGEQAPLGCRGSHKGSLGEFVGEVAPFSLLSHFHPQSWGFLLSQPCQGASMSLRSKEEMQPWKQKLVDSWV